jgi:branched-chain amino acid transport system ATP-binding protein
VRLAVQARAGGGADIASRWSSRRDWIEGADRFLAAANLADKRDTPAVLLPHGDKRKLEVAIMMALEPHVFMFDEPTAGMSVDDVPVILDLIKKLKSEGDKTILLVEHKMDVVKSLADRIVVLHNGRLVADGEPTEVIGSAIVQEAYLGVAATAKAGAVGAAHG